MEIFSNLVDLILSDSQVIKKKGKWQDILDNMFYHYWCYFQNFNAYNSRYISSLTTSFRKYLW